MCLYAILYFNSIFCTFLHHVVEKKEEIKWKDCEEIVPSKQMIDFEEKIIHAKMFTCGDLEIGHIIVNEAIANMNLENASKIAKEENSDLVTGFYEGNALHICIHIKVFRCWNLI